MSLWWFTLESAWSRISILECGAFGGVLGAVCGVLGIFQWCLEKLRVLGKVRGCSEIQKWGYTVKKHPLMQSELNFVIYLCAPNLPIPILLFPFHPISITNSYQSKHTNTNYAQMKGSVIPCPRVPKWVCNTDLFALLGL